MTGHTSAAAPTSVPAAATRCCKSYSYVCLSSCVSVVWSKNIICVSKRGLQGERESGRARGLRLEGKPLSQNNYLGYDSGRRFSAFACLCLRVSGYSCPLSPFTVSSPFFVRRSSSAFAIVRAFFLCVCSFLPGCPPCLFLELNVACAGDRGLHFCGDRESRNLCTIQEAGTP